jgi:uncharacterized RDD family membrane protein YckC
MKCPKCDYLGFETGDRCRNCGYDFSLVAAPSVDPGDLTLEPPASETDPVGDLWLGHAGHATGAFDGPLSMPARGDSAFPLFRPAGSDDDEPLIKLPAEPRAPLSVRRTPDLSRPRAAPRPPRRIETGLTLEFAEEGPAAPPPARPAPAFEPREAPTARAHVRREETLVASLGSRTTAAVIDHAILLGIDAIVIAGTLRMTALTFSEWQLLPPLPLLAFLVLVKLAYFSAFTAMGGQTIGKMAAGIRVVSDDQVRLDPSRAIRRTLTGAVSLLALGLGLIPALVGPERRTFHDRVAHTRVVALPSA